MTNIRILMIMKMEFSYFQENVATRFYTKKLALKIVSCNHLKFAIWLWISIQNFFFSIFFLMHPSVLQNGKTETFLLFFLKKVRPLSVEIRSLDDAETEDGRTDSGEESDVQEPSLVFSGHNKSWTCVAYGSYPAPKISWWIDDRFELENHQEVTFMPYIL